MPFIKMPHECHVELSRGFPKFAFDVSKERKINFMERLVRELLYDLRDFVDLKLSLH